MRAFQCLHGFVLHLYAIDVPSSILYALNWKGIELPMLLTICEDEPLIAQKLEHIIHQTFPSLKTQCVSSGEALLTSEKANIYLLDIRLTDANGVELAKQIRAEQTHAQIIFITAYEQYVFDTFDVEPLHYLVKPIDEQKLISVVQRAIVKCEQAPQQQTVTIQVGQEAVVLNIADLYFAEVQGRNITIHLADQILTYSGRISHLEQQLQGAFFRSHRSYIVHFKHISRYDQTTITFTNGKIAYIARNRYRPFLQAFTDFLHEGIT